jgi:CubicO group peptidase (beta-lactamase class C family)
MSRRTRLAAGWALALAAAILLQLALTAPATAPVADATATPAVSAVPSASRSTPAEPPPPSSSASVGTALGAPLSPLPADVADALQLATDRARRTFHLDAIAVGVALDDGRGWAGASGVGGDGVTPLGGDSPFAIASITKTFTTAVILQLIEEGRLTLGSEIGPLLPELSLPSGVTIELLLRHRSGIPDLLDPLRAALNADPSRRWLPAEVVAAVLPAEAAPDVAWAYSNTNFVLLGMIAERVTGTTYPDLLAERVLGPLRLDAAGLLLTDGAPPLMTPSWASAFGTAGGMYASADNLVRWGRSLYQGSVLLPQTRARMIAMTADRYGLGTELIEMAGRAGYGHTGLLRGFTSMLVYLPAERLTIVVMGTGPGFDPARLASQSGTGEASLLDLALAAAGS